MIRALLLAVLLCLPSLAIAQEVDDDYRLYDVIHGPKVGPKGLEGTILEGRDPGAKVLKIRPAGKTLVVTYKRSEIIDIVDRETPEKAFKTRSKTIRSQGDASLHRRLAEWGIGLGLNQLAEDELLQAIRAEGDAAAKLGHRVRLVGLLEQRAEELSGDERDVLFEAILAQTTRAGQPAPRLQLAEARVALAVELPEIALPLLQSAKQALDAKAAAGDGGGDDAGGDDAGDDDADSGADDFSPQKLPGLSSDERDLYRQVVTALAEAAGKHGEPQVTAEAYARLLEIWPQDKQATIGHALVLAAKGNTADGIAAVTETLKVHQDDLELLLLRGKLHYLAQHDTPARSDLERVLKQAEEGTETATDAGISLALVHVVAGRFKRAQPLLDAADADPGHPRAKLVKALLAEFSGDLPGAAELYEAAERMDTSAGASAYNRAFALLKAREPEKASKALHTAIGQDFDYRLAIQALIDVARRSGDKRGEGRLLELLFRATPDPQVDLLYGLGRIYLARKRIAEAQGLFERGLEQAPANLSCLSGLAYCAYARGDTARAKELFEQITAQDKTNAWAKQGLKNLREARTRRVWVDSFDRKPGDVLNGWKVESPFGVSADIDSSGRLAVRGEQKNKPGGQTRVLRRVTGERVVKFEVRLTVSNQNAGRAGIRFSTDRGEVVLFFDPGDKKVRVSFRKGKGGFSDPTELGFWPGPGSHALAIDVEDERKGVMALYVDGERRGDVKVPGMGRGRRGYDLIIYGQGRELGDAVQFHAHEAKVYVLREGN